MTPVPAEERLTSHIYRKMNGSISALICLDLTLIFENKLLSATCFSAKNKTPHRILVSTDFFGTKGHKLIFRHKRTAEYHCLVLLTAT
jgi:hypothetical protein